MSPSPASIPLDDLIAHARGLMDGLTPGELPSRERALAQLLVLALGYDPHNPDAESAARDILFTPTELGRI